MSEKFYAELSSEIEVLFDKIPECTKPFEQLLANLKKLDVSFEEVAKLLKEETNKSVIGRKLTDFFIENLKKKLNPHKKTVALGLSAGVREKGRFGLTEKLFLEKGFNFIKLLPLYLFKNDCGLIDEEMTFFVSRPICKKLDFLDVCIDTLPSILLYLPRNVKKIYSGHTGVLPNKKLKCDKNTAKMYTYRKLADLVSFNALTVTGLPECFDFPEIPRFYSNWQGKVSPIGHDSNNAHVIPIGNIKIDQIIRAVENRKEAPDSIIICPSWPQKKYYYMDNWGEELVRNLLDHFPEYKIILRPLPSTENREEYKNIVAEFSSNPAFSIDKSVPYYDIYASAALMITDISGTAITYSMATCRPVIYFHPDSAKSHIFDISEERFEIGTAVYNIPQLVNTTRYLFENIEEERKHIQEYRDRCANIGNSEEYLVEAVRNLIEDNPQKDWITVKFADTKPVPEPDTAEIIRIISRLMQEKKLYIPIIDYYGEGPDTLEQNPLAKLIISEMQTDRGGMFIDIWGNDIAEAHLHQGAEKFLDFITESIKKYSATELKEKSREIYELFPDFPVNRIGALMLFVTAMSRENDLSENEREYFLNIFSNIIQYCLDTGIEFQRRPYITNFLKALGNKHCALFGAGQHSVFLESVIDELPENQRPIITVILDDAPKYQEILGMKPVKASEWDFRSANIDTVIPSRDQIPLLRVQSEPDPFLK